MPGTVTVEEKGPIYLDERVFSSPAVALSLATKEIIRMASLAGRSFESSIQGFNKKDKNLLNITQKDEDVIDELEKAITFYLAKLS